MSVGGLEPLDDNLFDGVGTRGSADCSPGRYMWWWRCSHFSRETRPDRVSYYAGYARAGTHTLTFQAVA